MKTSQIHVDNGIVKKGAKKLANVLEWWECSECGYVTDDNVVMDCPKCCKPTFWKPGVWVPDDDVLLVLCDERSVEGL